MFVTLTKITDGETYDDDGVATETTTAASINPAHVKSFYARKHGRPGTRINFANGSGFCVSESREHVAAVLNGDPAPGAPLAITDQS